MKVKPMSDGPTTQEPPGHGLAPVFPRIGATDPILLL
jgi:hypothetical protein